ncbi:MAG: 4-(cytidine 5'-diphospho)-2-C-methyl-D-erythritol kinase [Betaproteobacteria bacterium]|nr:4-(cytidine 5'-diphospho)-2-C-methyl-D-erythritol kinase [Betaproteobacteria bacterium]
MSALYDILAPAKLNVFLHIVGRLSNGYHALQSVFMLIDWCDKLHIETTAHPAITRQDLGPPLPVNDLCVQAAKALQEAAGVRAGAHITLDKQLPSQAGLGGGSSDAASTLMALNRLWDLNWPRERLLPIALTLGADVPFFLHGQSAWVEGLGERITPIDLPEAEFVVLKPSAGLETALIFKDPGLKRDSEPATMTSFAEQGFDFGRNDLQPVAQKWCPEVKQALDWLERLGLQARMTGSGSAVFARLNHVVEWPAVPQGWQIQLCRNLKAHPLADWAFSKS